MSKIRGKVAVVTGAGAGIGRALALGLARRGARLALADVDVLGMADTADQAKAFGVQVHAAELDVSDPLAVEAYADEVISRYGIAHQLYNNAGIAGAGGSVLETDQAVFERVLAVNLWGVINGTRAFLPHLIASGDGHVINVSSINGIAAVPDLSAYCASKFAVRGFTETLRSEMLVAGHPVRVSVVHPGGVRTTIASTALADAQRRGLDVQTRHLERTRVYNEKLLRMPPEKAASIVLDGVEANRPRILVGADARIVDLLVRLAPRLYPRLAAWSEHRLFPTQ